ncbi:hypothetical protein HQQ80_15030 [Microbacteriaceae bacterium VKM Ac-2855]|nr:hypothetical protein [Microbacteriaceae bacterium VKM Ac-2855]
MRSRFAARIVFRAGLVLAAIVIAGLGAGMLAGATAPARPQGCTTERELLRTVSVLDRAGAGVLGSLSVCEDAALGTVTFTNRTPVVWSVPGRGVAASGDLTSSTAAGALLSGFWQRTARGALLPPNSSVRLPRTDAPYHWHPDDRATRTLLTIDAVLDAQLAAGAAAKEPDDAATRGVFASAALSCAAAVSDTIAPREPSGGALGGAAIRRDLRSAGSDIACSNAWMRARLVAQADGWSLPSLPRAFSSGDDRSAEAASTWFDLARGFVWTG